MNHIDFDKLAAAQVSPESQHQAADWCAHSSLFGSTSNSEAITLLSPRLSVETALKTILVVDDDAHIRDTLRLVLTKAGYHPLLAKDGQEAINLMQQGG